HGDPSTDASSTIRPGCGPRNARFRSPCGGDQAGKVVLQELTDPLHRDVRGRMALEMLRVGGVMALAREDRGDAFPPDLLHRAEDPHLVVDQDVAVGRIAALDVVELDLLVDVNEDV